MTMTPDVIMPQTFLSYEIPDAREEAWLAFTACQQIGWRGLQLKRMARAMIGSLTKSIVEVIVQRAVEATLAEYHQ
jgi:hypothetical protein